MPPQAQYIRVRTGIFERKHLDKIGGWPLVLYLWLHAQVRFKGDGEGVTLPEAPYTHERAVAALGQPLGSVRRWFRVLVDGEYIKPRHLRYGIELTITNYRPEPPRVSTNEHPGEAETVHQSAPSDDPGCPPVDARVSIPKPQGVHQRTPSNKEVVSRDSREQEIPARKRAASFQQRVIAAYLSGIRDDPADVPPSVYRRYLGDGAHLAGTAERLGATASDIAACTRAIAAGEWFQRTKSRPKMQTVRQRLEQWIAAGRPSVWQGEAPARATPQIRNVADLAATRLRQRMNANASNPDQNDAPGLRHLPDRHGTAHPQLPAPRDIGR